MVLNEWLLVKLDTNKWCLHLILEKMGKQFELKNQTQLKPKIRFFQTK